MRTWSIACAAALLALGLSATSARADEWNKLTYLTFSGPVAMPGITLPAGTYRFELMDPDSSRRVIRVSDKDGSKQYGIFLSISDQKVSPSDTPVVMFKEMPAGLPQAIQAWFYPGETTGYEFVYPHDQAQKIAKATHQPVLAMDNPRGNATTESDRVASMRDATVGRVDENGRPVSKDEQLKDSTTRRATTTAQASSPSTSATTAAGTSPTASSTTASSGASSSTASTANDRSHSTTAVGTSGRASGRSLPRTASPLPLLALLSTLCIAAAVGLGLLRRALV